MVKESSTASCSGNLWYDLFAKEPHRSLGVRVGDRVEVHLQGCVIEPPDRLAVALDLRNQVGRCPTHEPMLPRLAMLHALQVPTAGGGTYFADMRAAWDALDASRQEQLRQLTGLHRFNVGPAGGAAIYAGQRGAEAEAFEDQHHPAMIIHPRNGRAILFANPAHTHGFEPMDRDDGWTLVEALAEHATQARFTYLHTWRRGDLVMWDELATIHRGAGDAHPEEPRVLMRSIVYPA